MDMMDKYAAIQYIVSNNPVCNDCSRANLEHIRIAAGLYQLLKDIVSDNKESYSGEELTKLIGKVTKY